VTLKTQLAMYVAGKAADVILDRIKDAKENGAKVDLRMLIEEHGLKDVQSTIKVLSAHDEEALDSLFHERDRDRIYRFATGAGELYCRHELRQKPNQQEDMGEEVHSATELVEDVTSNPLLREGLSHAHKGGVLSGAPPITPEADLSLASDSTEHTSSHAFNDEAEMLEQARALMMGDGVVNPGELLSTIGLRNAEDIPIGDAVTVAARKRMQMLDDVMGMSLPGV